MSAEPSMGRAKVQGLDSQRVVKVKVKGPGRLLNWASLMYIALFSVRVSQIYCKSLSMRLPEPK